MPTGCRLDPNTNRVTSGYFLVMSGVMRRTHLEIGADAKSGNAHIKANDENPNASPSNAWGHPVTRQRHRLYVPRLFSAGVAAKNCQNKVNGSNALATRVQ